MFPNMMGMAFPGMDLVQTTQMLQNAVMNPEMGAQMFASMGMQPPPTMEGASPFATDFSSSERRDRVPTPPPAMTPGGIVSGVLDSTINNVQNAYTNKFAPDMANWGATPQSMEVGAPPPEAGSPNVMGSAAASAEFPLIPPTPAAANPFPTPIGEPQGNPFPTPLGSPPGASTPGVNPQQLGNALKGISVPKAPEPQRVSTPSPPPRPAALGSSDMLTLLAKMLGGAGAQQAVQPLRLGQSMYMPTIGRIGG